MKKDFLGKLQKKAFKWSSGRDYLRLIIKDDQLDEIDEMIGILDRLDTDNSSSHIMSFRDKKMTLFKVNTKSGQALIGTTVHLGVSVPIMFFERYDENTRAFSKSWGRIDYYGMFDRLLVIENGIKRNRGKEYIYGYLDILNKGKKISRYDFKVDFFHRESKKIFRPEDITKLRKNSKVEYKVVGGNIQSWRLGARKSKQYLIRGYDKQADTMAKGKFPMYKDYFTEVVKDTGEKIKYEDVYRLEFEFLNNFCRLFTYDTIDSLEDHIEKFINLDKSIGKIFSGNNNTDIGEVQDRFKYADSTKGYMKGCIGNGINIFGLLEDVFLSMGKTQDDIKEIFVDYLKRKGAFDNWTDKRSEIDMLDEIHRIFGYYQ